MKQFLLDELRKLWGPFFANSTIEMANGEMAGGHASIEYIQAVAIGRLHRKIEAMEVEIKKLKQSN